jgi:hypothetical protein
MNLFWREKKDGRRAPGYLLYLLGGASVVAAVLVLHGRAGAPARPPPRRRGQAATVGAITQPAALMSPVQVAKKSEANPPEHSFRLRPASPAPPAATRSGSGGSFDAIDAALAAAPPLPAVEPVASDSPYAALPPALVPPRPGREEGNPEARLEKGQRLLGYRDPTAEAMGAGARSAGPAVAEPVGRASAPRGSLLHVILLTTVDTSNPSAVLQFGLVRSLVFHRRVLLPFGTRLLGRLAGHPQRDRLNLTAETILFPDGRELPVAAAAVEADETGANLRPGVAAQYFPPPPWVQLAPYLSDVVTGFLGLLESRAQSQFALGVGGLSLQSSNPATLRAPLAQASGQAIQDFTAGRLKEMEERYASYFLIPAGTEFWLQLENDLALGPLHALRIVD